MAAASGLSESMILDDDSGAHEGSDDDNGDDGYGIESHGEQAAIARQVRLLLDLDRLGQIMELQISTPRSLKKPVQFPR